MNDEDVDVSEVISDYAERAMAAAQLGERTAGTTSALGALLIVIAGATFVAAMVAAAATDAAGYWITAGVSSLIGASAIGVALRSLGSVVRNSSLGLGLQALTAEEITGG